jgi:hypothetical protein
MPDTRPPAPPAGRLPLPTPPDGWRPGPTPAPTPARPQTLPNWSTSLPVLLYCAVMVLKLGQVALLLQRPGAHARWRRAILWTERALRTLVSVRMVAFAPPGAAAAAAAAAHGGGGTLGQALRALVLSSGFTVAYWNSEPLGAGRRGRGTQLGAWID